MFPLPPREAVILAEFVRALDARAIEEAGLYDHVFVWGNNERRAKLKGRRCRVLAHGTKNTILIEFENGEKVTTSRYAVRFSAMKEAA